MSNDETRMTKHATESAFGIWSFDIRHSGFVMRCFPHVVSTWLINTHLATIICAPANVARPIDALQFPRFLHSEHGFQYAIVVDWLNVLQFVDVGRYG
jgi:hypothetical protein